MKEITTDEQAWEEYPNYREFFNKLTVAESQKLKCGPGGVKVPYEGHYMVRPTYNLYGMGAGAEKKYLTPETSNKVAPGFFWCEWLEGIHMSFTYIKNLSHKKHFHLVSAYEGIKKNHREFSAWIDKTNYFDSQNAGKIDRSLISMGYEKSLILASNLFNIHNTFDSLGPASDHVPHTINIETIGNYVIDVHFRDSPDPKVPQFKPVYLDQVARRDPTKSTYIESFDDAGGWINNPRFGFILE